MSSWTRRSSIHGLRRALRHLIQMNSIPGSPAICLVGSVYPLVHSDSCDPKTNIGSSARYFLFCMLSHPNPAMSYANPTRLFRHHATFFMNPESSSLIHISYHITQDMPLKKKKKVFAFHVLFLAFIRSHLLFVQKIKSLFALSLLCLLVFPPPFLSFCLQFF